MLILILSHLSLSLSLRLASLLLTKTSYLCQFQLLLYFGAYWVEGCTKFTPKLHLFNQLQSDRGDFEIVFLSMDKNEDEYKKYSGKMGWWCLPYAMSTLPQLIVKYQAHEMPHVVVLDTDGTVLTKEGVQRLTQDPVGKDFPWRPKRVVDLLPTRYLAELPRHMKPMMHLDDKYLLLYFASNSDALSKEFTPWLMKAYNIMKKSRDDFEVSVGKHIFRRIYAVLDMLFRKKNALDVSFTS